MAHRMAHANPNRMADRMAKPMRSRWQNDAPNPNPNPKSFGLRFCSSINQVQIQRNLGMGRFGLGALR